MTCHYGKYENKLHTTLMCFVVVLLRKTKIESTVILLLFLEELTF